MGFLAGKRAVIVGLASNRSIAWGIAQALKQQGAELVPLHQQQVQEAIDHRGDASRGVIRCVEEGIETSLYQVRALMPYRER